jgi:SPP1 family predicted phage head-tail adaptor
LQKGWTGYDGVAIADTTVGSGALNRRVTIQQPSDVDDGQGGTTRTWATVVTTWGHISAYRGMEAFQGQQVYPSKWVKIRIRYRPGVNITNTMRAMYKSQVYNIRSVTVPEEAQTMIELLAEELQARGSI